MASVARALPAAQPTHAAPRARLFASTPTLGLERWLARPQRGVSTLALSLLGLGLAWRGSGRPDPLLLLQEPLRVALLGIARRPPAETWRRSLASFPAQARRRAGEPAYQAERPRRTGRGGGALDAPQVPYGGRGEWDRLPNGWAGHPNRCRRGARRSLAGATDPGQVLTSWLLRGDTRDHQVTAVLARRGRPGLGRRLAGVVADGGVTSHAAGAAVLAARLPFLLGVARAAPSRRRWATLPGQQRRWRRDGGAIRLGGGAWDARLQLLARAARSPPERRGPGVYVTRLQGLGPGRRIARYRQRGRGAHAIEEWSHGHDRKQLVSTRLHPNRGALGFRLLARHLARGRQSRAAAARPTVIREPLAFRATHGEGLGTFEQQRRTLFLAPLQPLPPRRLRLPGTRRVGRLVA